MACVAEATRPNEHVRGLEGSYRMQETQTGKRLGRTQSKILQTLLQADSPLPVQYLTQRLKISRNATYQHVTTLERDGLIEKASISQTKGRPSQTYQLTDAGREVFPKHYALFATLLVRLVKSRMGAREFESCLADLGDSLADQHLDRVAGLEGDALIREVANIMSELGYESEASLPADGGAGLEIRAHNCVFHELAQEHEEVCALDIALISRLTGRQIEHAECVVRGGACCRFRALARSRRRES